MIEWCQYLARDPQICHGQVCAKGTRVFVTNILDSLAEGASREEILRSYVANSARVHTLALMGRLSLPPVHSPKTGAAVWIYLASLRLIRRGIGNTSEIVIYSITQNAGPKPGLKG